MRAFLSLLAVILLAVALSETIAAQQGSPSDAHVSLGVVIQRAGICIPPQGLGAPITAVRPGSSADRAGLKAGDLVVHFGGTDIKEWRDLPRAVQLAHAGDHVGVLVNREGVRVTLQVQFTQADVVAPSAVGASAPGPAPTLGAPPSPVANGCISQPYRVLPLPADARARLAAKPQCRYDRIQLLALNEQQFDQDLENGGWRGVAARSGCESVAADLVRDYRETHRSRFGILYWHEGQLRAMAGDYKRAITVMEQSRDADDPSGGWNLYVDATIAFLKRDRAALLEARTRLAAIRPMNGEQVQDGFVSLRTSSGQEVKVRWPVNIDVVDGLIQCFDRPYRAAYGSECRSPASSPAP
jgi:PDZ domain